MKLTIYAMLLMVGISSCYAQEILDAEAQIQQAILALPEEFREDATVLGYKNSSELVVIRKGNNDMICLADDPKKDGFSVAGYHNDLEPFMKRGRTLRQEGKSAADIFKIRGEDVASGKIKIPSGTVLYITSGIYDEQGQPADLYQRFVVYLPYATAESTGLSLTPTYPGGPWIMNPGTHRAHIMINPTRVEDKK